jgi:pimeloyl-ACP methyl ester carboxylesterase
MHRTALGLVLVATAATTCAASLYADQLPFAKAQRLVDIGGRRLNLYCSGDGPVTVVFSAASGDAGWSWYQVQPEVAKRTRACVYDRAGQGFSDPSPLPPTFGNTVDDLHALLGKAGVKPPYVMVGVSYGGAVAQMYAWRHPAEVKGLVLVEPHHEDETDRLDKAAQGKLKQVYAMQDQMQQQCVAESRKGFTPGSEMFQNCTGGIQPAYGPQLAAARLSVETSARYWQATAAEGNLDDGANFELKSARRSFGDLPLIVLTRGVSPYAVPGRPQSALNKAMEDENRAMHRELAAQSTRGSERVVEGAGHVIQQTRPEAVVKAVLEVVEQAGR